MERKISFKNLYLIGVISLGLIGLGVGSTFAMFTASAEISDSISLTSGLEYTDDIVDLVDMTISSNKVETATLNITNNTNKTLNYTSWYKTNNSNIQIGTVVSNNKSVTGTIQPNETIQIIVSIRNRSTGVAKVTVGISASEGDIVVSNGITTLPSEPLPPYLSDYITNLYNTNKDTTVTNNEIQYQYASSVNLMNDRLGGTTEDLNGGNIRYYGASPNNYIDIGDRTSNDEVILWRIIGVFDGKVRIRRDESIGNYSFDVSPLNVNDGRGINEWSQADIMKLLNPGYENNKDLDKEDGIITINNSLWWNSGSGNCYLFDGSNNNRWKIETCDFTSNGLSDEVKEYVVDQTLYLGGFNTNEIYSDQSYKIERETNVWNSTMIENCSNEVYCNDTVTRTTSWIGKVGLIYPSDLGYASDLRKEECQDTLDVFSNCDADNWMAVDYSWTVSPWLTAYNELDVSRGDLFASSSNSEYGGWPTLLLNQNVIKMSGTGTDTDPYVID